MVLASLANDKCSTVQLSCFLHQDRGLRTSAWCGFPTRVIYLLYLHLGSLLQRDHIILLQLLRSQKGADTTSGLDSRFQGGPTSALMLTLALPTSQVCASLLGPHSPPSHASFNYRLHPPSPYHHPIKYSHPPSPLPLETLSTDQPALSGSPVSSIQQL